MHFGRENKCNEYNMELGQGVAPHIIEKTLIERDLGLIISSDLKWVNQIDKATNNAKSIIAQIRNSFSYFDAELVRLLYVSLIRPHLEFAVSVWNPYQKKDIDKLEKIQHKATKLVPKIKWKFYEYRLAEMRLTTLETRRKRGDLIQFFKIINGIDQVKWKNKLEKTLQGIENGPVPSNLRKKASPL